jgi:hypothetical protein
MGNRRKRRAEKGERKRKEVHMPRVRGNRRKRTNLIIELP